MIKKYKNFIIGNLIVWVLLFGISLLIKPDSWAFSLVVTFVMTVAAAGASTLCIYDDNGEMP